jgi:hypothetical protein
MSVTTRDARAPTAGLDLLDRAHSHVTTALATGTVLRIGESPLGAAP